MEHDCRKQWFESLAYVTFVACAKPRTHILKVCRCVCWPGASHTYSTYTHTSRPSARPSHAHATRILHVQLADKDSSIGLFLVQLQRFDVADGRGGFAIMHRFERLPDSRYIE